MWAVLFTDVVGSTEQRVRIGDNAANALRKDHDSIVALALARHHGELVEGTGDGAMCAFASAADALEAGVALQQGVERRNRHSDEPIRLRVGVSLGDFIYDDSGLMGLAAHEAARICALCEAGEVLVSDVVRALAAPRTELVVVARGEFEFKGLPSPVSVWQVEWEPAAEPEVPRPSALLVPPDAVRFAGRERELATILDAWGRARGGSGSAVLLAGEPGIGKTRLAAEIARVAAAEGALVLYGRCDDQLRVPFQPFAEVLSWYLQRAETVVVGRHADDLARLSPMVGERVTTRPPAASDPETDQYRLFDGLVSWLTELADAQPVVLVVDDLHWATQPTLLMLRHLLRAVGSARLLIVATYRDTDVDHDTPLGGMLVDISRLACVRRLSLSGLEAPSVLELLQGDGSPQNREAPRFAQVLADDTAGNPFFIVEVLRHLAETGVISAHEDRFELTRPIDELGVPDGVRDLLEQRLRLLGEGATDVLGAAAIIGRDFEVDALGAVSTVGDDRVLDVLERASSARLVHEVGPGRFYFAHALVQTTLVDNISATRRMRLHRRIAEHLEHTHPDDVGGLAYHWSEAGSGGDLEKAVRYSVAAGVVAVERRAYREATEHYERALALDGGGVLHADERCDLLIELGQSRHWSGMADFRSTIFEAAELAQHSGDVKRLVRAALALDRGNTAIWGAIDERLVRVWRDALGALGDEPTADRARLLATLARELLYAPVARRAPVAEEALSIALQLDDPELRVDVAHPLLNAGWRAPAVVRAITGMIEGVADTAFDAGRQYTRAAVLRHLGMFDADLDAVRRADEEIYRLIEETPWPYRRFMGRLYAAGTAFARGELELAERLGAEAFEVGSAAGQLDATVMFGALLGLVRRDQGRTGEVIDLFLGFVDEWHERPGLPLVHAAAAFLAVECARLNEARRILELEAARDFYAPENNPTWLEYHALLGDASVGLGDVDLGAVLYERLAPHAGQLTYDSVFLIGTVDNTMGRLALLCGWNDRAVHHLKQAAHLADRFHAPLFRARAVADQARLARIEGDTARSDELIEAAVAVARAHGAFGVERYALAAGAA